MTAPTPINPAAQQLMTASDVATYLNISPSQVKYLARQGHLRGIKVGKLWRFDRGDVAAFIALSTTDAAPVTQEWATRPVLVPLHEVAATASGYRPVYGEAK